MKYFFFIITIILFSSCDVKPQQESADEIYLSQRQPFEIPVAEKYIQIPDSLRPDNFHEGMLVINYFVNAKGTVEGTNIRLLRMKDKKGEKLIWYYNESMRPVTSDYYPKEVQPYLDWVYTYAKTRKIVKIKEVKNELKWMMSVMVRLE